MRKTNKTIAAIFAAATIAVFMASCKKDVMDQANLQLVGVERTINATATIPQEGDKAYLDVNDDRKVKWDLTDAININGTNLALTNLNADPTKAYFEGSAYAIPSGSEDIYWAVYPTTLAGTASGNTIPSNFTATSLTVNFPATQTYDCSANALSGNTLMAGYAVVPSGEDKVEFQMRNLGAVLKLRLSADASATNTMATKIEFTTTNGALAGDFTVSNGTNPTITPTANVKKILTVNLTDGTNNFIDLRYPKDIYVILPPMSSKNLTMTIYNTNIKQSRKTITSATLARNKIYRNTVSDLCFCHCGGGSPYFSISPTKQVVFAPGNLQWSATGGGTTATTHAVAGGGTAAGTWRFASSQFEYIGNAAGNNTPLASRPTQAAWIDLFGWATSGYHDASDALNTNYNPYNLYDLACCNLDIANPSGFGPTGNQNLEGAYANYDWGVYNAIYNPQTNTTDPPGTWRLLTFKEWEYLLLNRNTCSRVLWAKAQVNGVNGLIILPDNWDDSKYALNTAAYTITQPFSNNTISVTDWTNIFEPAGCVFLPAAGCVDYDCDNDLLSYESNEGFYWSSNSQGRDNATSYWFKNSNGNTVLGKFKCSAASVRLAKEVH